MQLNILGNLMGGMVDKEKIARESIINGLNEVLASLNENRHFEDHYTSKDFWVMIKPTGHKFEDGETEVEGMKLHVYFQPPGAVPKFVREITLKEILGIED